MADGAACTATERTIVEVAVEVIDRHPTNPRNLPREDEPALRAACADIIDTIEVDDAGEPINGRGVRDAVKLRRKAGDRFELVDGERRWHAARFTGLRRLLAEIVVMSDEEVLAEQLRAHGVELTTLEEAAALARMRDEYSLDVAEIAARTGRTPRLVRQRLALLTLVPAAREALAAGKITLGLALDLATLAPDAQADAIGPIVNDFRGEPIGRGAGHWHIDRRRLNLAGAGFDLADATLPGGSCLKCPKRTGAQAELFADGIQSKDQCGDLKCFEAKREASAHRLKEKAKTAKIPFVEAPAEVKKFYRYGATLNHDALVIDLDARCDLVRPPEMAAPKNEGRRGGPEKCSIGDSGEHEWFDVVREDEEDCDDDREAARAGCEAWRECDCGAWEEADPPSFHRPTPRGWKPPTWREALGSALAQVEPKVSEAPPAVEPTMMVKAPDGAVRQLVERKDAVQLLQKAGVISDRDAKAEIREASPLPKKKPGQLDKHEVDRKAKDEARDEARAQIAAKASKRAADLRFYRLLAGLVLADVDYRRSDVVDEAWKRRAADDEEKPKAKKEVDAEAELRAWVAAEKDEGAIRGLVVELLTVDGFGQKDTPFAIACRFYGVEFDELQKAAAARIRADQKAKAKKAAEKSKAAEKKGKSSSAPEGLADGKLVACPKCKAKVGGGCIDSRGMSLPLGRVHKERTAAAQKASAKPVAQLDQLPVGYVDDGIQITVKGRAALAQPEPHELPAPADPPRPLDWLAVQALAKRAGIDDPHEGANSPANVWGCVARIRGLLVVPLVPDAKPEATRQAFYDLRPSAGTASFDIAIQYLVDVGEIALVERGKKPEGDTFRRVPPGELPETVHLEGKPWPHGTYHAERTELAAKPPAPGPGMVARGPERAVAGEPDPSLVEAVQLAAKKHRVAIGVFVLDRLAGGPLAPEGLRAAVDGHFRNEGWFDGPIADRLFVEALNEARDVGQIELHEGAYRRTAPANPTVPCAVCKAEAGAPCVAAGGKALATPHAERLKAAAKQPALPGQAGQSSPLWRGSPLWRAILSACAKERTRKQIVLACKDHLKADVETEIDKLHAEGLLSKQGEKYLATARGGA